VLVGPEVTPTVSVLLVLWNAAPFVDGCLGALSRSSVPVEVLAFDNASADGSADAAEALGAAVTRSPTNRGFPYGVNALLPAARAESVLLLNPDVELAPGAVETALAALAGPGVGMVGINLRRPDGRPDGPAARRFRTVGTILVESLGLGLLSPRLDLQYLPGWDRSTDRDVPCINGAFMLLRTDTLRAVGGLDETVFLYLEDQELCRAIHARGERIRFVAAARATHVGGGSTEAADPDQQAVAYLHRLDASLEIIRRRQGSVARMAALGILALRCATQLLLATITRADDRRLKHRTALRWLARQVPHRRPPPVVP
jgi:N-acetylglucosaminyl-diphospho-decaprenol L-rhamnosyltransferase